MKFITLLLIFTSIAFAQDDCRRHPESMKSAIDSKSPSVEKVTLGTPHKDSYSETATLKNKMIVSYTNGGCNYLAINWYIRNFGVPPHSNKAKIIDFVIAKLESIPVRQSGWMFT